jgi:hypothetical protein
MSARHLYATNGGAPWASATSAEEALERVRHSDFADDAGPMTQIPDDELFTMTFDELPSDMGLEANCTHEVDETYLECLEDCGESRFDVTLPAGEWAKSDRHTDGVFGEYEL